VPKVIKEVFEKEALELLKQIKEEDRAAVIGILLAYKNN
jgi:hypothetical protein